MTNFYPEFDSVIALSSMTYAVKGEAALKYNNIQTKIVRLSPSQTTRGCAYGLAVNSRILESARQVLSANEIPAGETVK